MDVKKMGTAWARGVLADPRTAVLDTETTGLEGYACEISLLAVDGTRLLDTLLNPLVPIEPGAQAIHGLSAEKLATEPTFAVVWPKLAPFIESRRIIVYNASFDSKVIMRELARIGALPPAPPKWECAMIGYSNWRAGQYDARWLKLNGGHRAADDCLATIECLREMANG